MLKAKEVRRFGSKRLAKDIGASGRYYAFMVARDLSAIDDPHPIIYPFGGMWNDDKPFSEIGRKEIESLLKLRELVG